MTSFHVLQSSIKTPEIMSPVTALSPPIQGPFTGMRHDEAPPVPQVPNTAL